jgi:hypothetical protein
MHPWDLIRGGCEGGGSAFMGTVELLNAFYQLAQEFSSWANCLIVYFTAEVCVAFSSWSRVRRFSLEIFCV